MFKIVKHNKRQIIVNSNGDIIYTPPNHIAFSRQHDLTKLLNALNKKGFRCIESVMEFESGKLK